MFSNLKTVTEGGCEQKRVLSDCAGAQVNQGFCCSNMKYTKVFS